MRMTSWFESLRRQFGSVTGAKSRRHGSGRTRRLTTALVESLEDRCLLAAGDLDLSFGVAGKVTTNFGSSIDKVAGVEIQSDGKIVAAGVSDGDFAVVRYNSDGSSDTSFDGDGKVTTVFTSKSNNYGYGLVLQVDGKIVVAGEAHVGNKWNFALARYNTNGSLDTSFDGDSKLTTAFGTSSADSAYSVALQSDGKIVVAGRTFNGNNNDIAIARYNSNGSLDTSFDGDGMLTTDFGVSSGIATSVVIQSDDKILVAGRYRDSLITDCLLVRYNSDGSLDTSFDGDGILTTSFGISHSQAESVVIQADGKIIAAGYMDNGSNFDFALARYNSDGSLDTSFDGDGKLITDFSLADDFAYNVAIQSNGQIVVVGTANNGGDTDFAVARYNTDGSLDTSFNGDGKLTTDFGSSSDSAYSVALQSDGKIVVAGIGTSTTDFALARYNSSGPPTFTSANTISVAENTTAVTTVTATDADLPAQMVTFSITGGADESRFSITSGGVLTFVAAPDFENPTDANTDNTYLVQVTANDGDGGTTLQDLTVTVTDIAPVNEAPVITGPPFVNSSQRPVISWTAVTGATEYEIWVTKNPSTNQYHGVTVTQTSYTPPVDFGIGKFNLWVRAKNSETIGPWTPKYTFVINTATVLHGITRFQPTLRPTISWDVLPGAVKYDVWINDVSRGIVQKIRNINVSGTSFTPSADLPVGVYRAWVRGIAVDGTAAAWSGMTEFVTMQAPTITQGQNPTFNRTPTFAWNTLPGAATYEVFIRNRNTGETTLYEKNITSLSFTPSIPLPDGPYRWWAIGVSAQGVRSFWTAPMDIHVGGRSEVLTPLGSTSDTMPTFTWRPVDGAVRYDLWVNQVGGQAQIIRQQNLTGTNYTPITSLPTGSYRAWIRAVSSTGEVSPWSLEVAFTITAIAPLGDLESADGIPDGMLAVLREELQVKNRGLNTTRSSRRIIDTEEIQPEERMPRIDGRDWASMPTSNDVRSEQFADDLLVAAIHEFLEGTCL